MEVISTIRDLRTRHAVVTGTMLSRTGACSAENLTIECEEGLQRVNGVNCWKLALR